MQALRQLFSGAHESRERYAATGRKPIPRQPFCGATELRKRYAESGRQPIFLHPVHGAHELRKRYALSGLGISPLAGGGNVPHARRAQKGKDTYGFLSSLNSYLSLGDLANEPYGSTS